MLAASASAEPPPRPPRQVLPVVEQEAKGSEAEPSDAGVQTDEAEEPQTPARTIDSPGSQHSSPGSISGLSARERYMALMLAERIAMLSHGGSDPQWSNDPRGDGT